jgi:hypothetical protein
MIGTPETSLPVEMTHAHTHNGHKHTSFRLKRTGERFSLLRLSVLSRMLGSALLLFWLWLAVIAVMS